MLSLFTKYSGNFSLTERERERERERSPINNKVYRISRPFSNLGYPSNTYWEALLHLLSFNWPCIHESYCWRVYTNNNTHRGCHNYCKGILTIPLINNWKAFTNLGVIMNKNIRKNFKASNLFFA